MDTNDTYVHLHMAPRYPTLEEFKELLAADWKAAALEAYSLDYSFDEKTREEYLLVLEFMKLVREACPAEFRVGVYLIGPGEAHCGEDIYVVDGDLDHNRWMYHRKCDKAALIDRGEQLWCAGCMEPVGNGDTMSLEEKAGV